jgi:phage shock protein A
MAGPVRNLIRIITHRLAALFAPAEDPRQAFEITFSRQRQLLTKVQQALEDIGEAKSRLEVKAEKLETKIEQFKERARHCVNNHREDLARLELRQAEIASAELKRMQHNSQLIEKDVQKLLLIERQVSSQLEAFHNRQEYLVARYSAAEAQVQICEALTGVSDEFVQLSRVLELAKLESERMLARAAAVDRLMEDGILEIPSNHFDKLVAANYWSPDDHLL